MEMQVVGANERLRCYRYAPGQRFKPHFDGSFARDHDERSLLTFMVYLNDDFEGGETALLDLDQMVAPKTGSALLFQHPILHEGCTVTRGVKYALRSDIMYRRIGA
jgi:prolyl 4-hydroxylase